jgi:hypothetical protein
LVLGFHVASADVAVSQAGSAFDRRTGETANPDRWSWPLHRLGRQSSVFNLEVFPFVSS